MEMQKDINDCFEKTFASFNVMIEEIKSRNSNDVMLKNHSIIVIDSICRSIQNIEVLNVKFDLGMYMTSFRNYINNNIGNEISSFIEDRLEEIINNVSSIYFKYCSDKTNEVYVLDFNDIIDIAPVIKTNDGKSNIIGMIFYNSKINKYNVMPCLEEIPYINVFKKSSLKYYESLTTNISGNFDMSIFERDIISNYILSRNSSIDFIYNLYPSSLFPNWLYSIVDKIAFENACASDLYDGEEHVVRKMVRDNYSYYDNQIMMNVGSLNESNSDLIRDISQYKLQLYPKGDPMLTKINEITTGFADKNSAMMYLYSVNMKIVADKYSNKASGFINDILNF